MRREHRPWTCRATTFAPSNSTISSTPKHLEHASEQARARNYQDFLIVDVDSHHYENEHYNEVFQYIESPVIRARGRCRARAAAPASSTPRSATRTPAAASPRTVPRKEREGPARRQAHRHHAHARLDGCDGRRLLLHVPDADAVPRPASAGRDRGRDVPRLQPLALRAHPGARAAHRVDAVSAVQRSGSRLQARSRSSATRRAWSASW